MGIRNLLVILWIALVCTACSKENEGRIELEELGMGGVEAEDWNVDAEYVELAGINWATCNIGAKRPELYGNLYSWIYDARTWQETLDGTGWRLPTKNEFQELIDKCVWEHQTTPLVMEYGWYVEGYNVTDPQNGNSIFLPEAGKVYPGRDVEWGDGYYWTSDIQIMRYAWYLNFGDNWRKMSAGKDYFTGMSIRLVFDPKDKK